MTEVKKTKGRGIGTAKGTSRLKFTHENAVPNKGLFQAHIDNVVVGTAKIGEDTTGMPQFNGMEIPRLVITFASNEADATKRHYVSLSWTAQESNIDTIPGGNSAWKIDSIFDYMKHIVDVLVLKGKEITPEIEEALTLPFDDTTEDGEYIPLEAETIIAGWTTLFQNFAKLLNEGKNGKPVYQDNNGKPYPLWIKLLRYTKVKNNWKPVVSNEDLAFPTFVGEGVIETLVEGVEPTIHINATKEAIRPMSDKVRKEPNMPGTGGPAIPSMYGGGMDMGGFGPGDIAANDPF